MAFAGDLKTRKAHRPETVLPQLFPSLSPPPPTRQTQRDADKWRLSTRATLSVWNSSPAITNLSIVRQENTIPILARVFSIYDKACQEIVSLHYHSFSADHCRFIAFSYIYIYINNSVKLENRLTKIL